MCYSFLMTTESKTKSKRGRKSIGTSPMSAAERKRRSRELQKAAGVREFLIQVQGVHLTYIEALARRGNLSPAEVLHGIVETALDRNVGVMNRCQQMRENGASDEEIEIFITANLAPTLPTVLKMET